MTRTLFAVQQAAFAAAILGFAVLALLAGFDLAGALHGLLAAAAFWIAFPLGGLAILMTYALTGGRWGETALPLARALTAALPVSLTAFLLLLAFGMETLFGWTAPPSELPEVVQRKTLYLNQPFFILRSLLYFAVWSALAFAFGAWGAERPARAGLAAAGLILWVFTTTFFAFDWLMSLEPTWYSDILGLLFGVEQGLAALAAVLLLAWARVGPFPEEGTLGQLSDLASLLLVLVLGWVFLDFSQYLIIWMANLPHEIGWYLHRSEGGWRVMATLVIVFVVLLPFAALLSGRVKRRRGAMLAVCASVLLGHALHCYWLVLPSFHREGFALSWSALAAWLGLGGASLLIALGRLSGSRLDLRALLFLGGERTR